MSDAQEKTMNDQDIKEWFMSQFNEATGKININSDNYQVVNDALKILQGIAEGSVSNADKEQLDSLSRQAENISSLNAQKDEFSGREGKFASFLTGESISALDNYESFYDTLLSDGILDGEESEAYLITRSEAESLGLHLKKNARCVVMVNEPDEEHPYTWEQNWYHVSEIQEQDRIKEICFDKGYRYTPVPEVSNNSPTPKIVENPKTRGFLTGSIIGGFLADDYDSFKKNLIRRNVIKEGDQLYLLSESDADRLGIKINEDARSIIVNGSEEKFYHVSDVKDQDWVQHICRDNGYKYNPVPDKLPDLKLSNISMLVNDKMRHFDELRLYSMDGESYIFGDKAAFMDNPTKPGTFVTIEKNKYENIIKAQEAASIKPLDPLKKEMFLTDQYDDFFTCRKNNHLNFRHNLSVLCRKEANSPVDAIKIAQNLISDMPPDERRATQKVLSLYKRNDQTFNQLVVDFYHEAVKEVPLNQDYVLKYRSDKLIKPYNDVISTPGKKIANDRSLVVTVNGQTKDMNLEVGQTLPDLTYEMKKLFGKGSEKVNLSNLKIVSASRENNSVTLMDEGKMSYLEVKMDDLLSQYKKQAEKKIKSISRELPRDIKERQDRHVDRTRRHDLSMSR